MKVFVSWSGELSGAVARTLREQFPNVLQGLEVYMSEKDIESGAPWFGDIQRNLADSDVGIIVVTRQNRERPWLLFEAGALTNRVDKARVTPLLVDLANPELGDPLGQFQTRTLGHDDIRTLLADLNKGREGTQRLSDATFESTFGKWWTDIDSQFSAAKEKHLKDAGNPKPQSRSPEELFAEVLRQVRRVSLLLEATATTQSQMLHMMIESSANAFSLANPRVAGSQGFQGSAFQGGAFQGSQGPGGIPLTLASIAIAARDRDEAVSRIARALVEKDVLAATSSSESTSKGASQEPPDKPQPK